MCAIGTGVGHELKLTGTIEDMAAECALGTCERVKVSFEDSEDRETDDSSPNLCLRAAETDRDISCLYVTP